MTFSRYYYVATRGLDPQLVGSGTTIATSENQALQNVRKKCPRADRYFIETMPAPVLHNWVERLEHKQEP